MLLPVVLISLHLIRFIKWDKTLKVEFNFAQSKVETNNINRINLKEDSQLFFCLTIYVLFKETNFYTIYKIFLKKNDQKVKINCFSLRTIQRLLRLII